MRKSLTNRCHFIAVLALLVWACGCTVAERKAELQGSTPAPPTPEDRERRPAIAASPVEEGAGKMPAELALRGCVVAALKRDDRLVVPNGSTRLQEGDVLTLVGGESAVYSAREKLDGTS